MIKRNFLRCCKSGRVGTRYSLSVFELRFCFVDSVDKAGFTYPYYYSDYLYDCRPNEGSAYGLNTKYQICPTIIYHPNISESNLNDISHNLTATIDHVYNSTIIYRELYHIVTTQLQHYNACYQ